MEFDTINKRINIFEKRGSDKGVYFIDSLNLISLEVQSNSYDFYTRLIAIGKGDLKVTVENFQYSNKVKTYIWKDERYTNLESLTEDATAKLNDISKPYKAYIASILDLANINEEYKDILNYELGDIITLISKDKEIKEKQRIVKIVEYPDEPYRNTCEIANTILKFEDIQKEFQDTTDTVNNITTDNGTIDGNTINGIRTEQIYDFEAKVGKIVDLEAVNARIDVLYAEKANVGELNAVVANVAELNATKLNVADANIQFANINAALIGKADITELNAVSGKIDVLESDTAYIKNLVNGNLTSDNIHSLILTSSKVTVENGFIKNAMIENVDVSKLNAGIISTEKFIIKSADGGIEINGSTQQFKDKNNKVRLQLGKDSQGNFNFILSGEDGTSVLLDHTGLKRNAIADGLIINNMIGPGAVTGDKVNIGSLIQEVNKDANTSTIKATKIQLDKEGQSLDIAFNTLKTNVNNIQVGGRNLMQNTSDFVTTKFWSNNASAGTGIVPIIEDSCIKGKRSIKHEFAILEADTEYICIATIKSDVPNLSPSAQTPIHLHVMCDENTAHTNYVNAKCEYYEGDVYAPNKFTTYKLTFKTKPNITNIRFRFMVYHSQLNNSENANQSTIWLKRVKLEKGNKATDYTKAPEDIENRIESNTTQITAQQGKIEALISDTSIVEDGSTKKLKDAYASLKLTVNGLNSTVGSHTTNISNLQGQINTANSNISNLNGKVQAVESKQVSFEQNLNSITQRVSSSESKVTTLQGQMTTANNNINVANNNITSVGNKLDNLQIGGRNEWIFGNFEGKKPTKIEFDYGEIVDLEEGNITGFKKAYHSTNTRSRVRFIWMEESKKGLGKIYTFSCWIKYNNVVVGSNTWSKLNIFKQSLIYKKTDGTSTSVAYPQIRGVEGSSDWVRVSGTLTYSNDKEYVAMSTNPWIGLESAASGEFWVTGIQIEEGNKLTAWSPSPEDTEASIIAVENKVIDLNVTVENTKSQVAELKTDLNGITQKVSSTESNVTTLTGKVNTANNNISTLQGQMNTANNNITSVTNNLNNLQIGVSNLIIGTKEFKIDSNRVNGFRNDSSYSISYSEADKCHIATAKASGLTSSSIKSLVSSFVPCKNGDIFTCSVWIKVKDINVWDVKNPFVFEVFDSSNTRVQYEDVSITNSKTNKPTVINNTWVKFIYTGIIANSNAVKMGLRLTLFRNGEISFKLAKVEIGNKSTDWSPAPQDVESDINAIDVKITTTTNKVASIETNLSSITSRVSSTESSIKTINGNVTSLQDRMSTAEHKITSDSIVSTVRSSTAYTNDLNAKANQSALNTTNSNLSGLTTRVNSVEQKITPSSITTTISSAINGGTSSISTTQFVMDRNGFTVKNGAITVRNKSGQVVLSGNSNGDLTFNGYLVGKDQQVKLIGDTMKIDGRNGALRFQYDSKNYLYLHPTEGIRYYTTTTYNLGITAPAFHVASDGHFSIYTGGARLKLLKSGNQIQSRTANDSGYASVAASDFYPQSSSKFKSNIKDTDDLDFMNIVNKSMIRQYNFKTDVEERVVRRSRRSLDSNESVKPDIKLGVVVEELPEEVKKYLVPNNSEGISLYNMTSILWGAVQEQQQKIDILESKIKKLEAA